MKNKRIPVILFFLVMIIFGVFFTKYGWKEMEFQMLTDPKFVIASVSEEDNKIIIAGTSALSVGDYDGYYSETIGDTLYFGVHYSLFGKADSFKIEVPQTQRKINRVVIKKGNKEKEIWRR